MLLSPHFIHTAKLSGPDINWIQVNFATFNWLLAEIEKGILIQYDNLKKTCSEYKYLGGSFP